MQSIDYDVETSYEVIYEIDKDNFIEKITGGTIYYLIHGTVHGKDLVMKSYSLGTAFVIFGLMQNGCNKGIIECFLRINII